MNESMEMTFTIEDADLDKLYDVVKEINVKECPCFEVQDKHGNKARYYRESHWISCKERLPESYVDVLVWFEYYRYGSYNRLYQTHGIGTYSENYDSWTINHESGWHKLRVIAWQPLPESYQEVKE